MGALEKIMQLKQQGQTEPQIIESLKQEGVSPKEINEGLSQSKIKSALTEAPQSTAEIQPGQESGMQPSMMQTPEQQDPQIQAQAQQANPMQAQEMPPQQGLQQIPSSMQPSTTPIPEQTTQFQEPMAPQPQDYSYQEPYPEYQETNIETISEVANQLVDEKTSELKKQISLLARFREEASLEITKINERLTKVEDTLNELQIAIIGKIGEYGKDIQNISKEMNLTQESFSKVLNPLTDNIREMQKLTGKEIEKPKPKTRKTKTKKQTSSFEDYLR